MALALLRAAAARVQRAAGCVAWGTAWAAATLLRLPRRIAHHPVCCEHIYHPGICACGNRPAPPGVCCLSGYTQPPAAPRAGAARDAQLQPRPARAPRTPHLGQQPRGVAHAHEGHAGVLPRQALHQVVHRHVGGGAGQHAAAVVAGGREGGPQPSRLQMRGLAGAAGMQSVRASASYPAQWSRAEAACGLRQAVGGQQREPAARLAQSPAGVAAQTGSCRLSHSSRLGSQEPGGGHSCRLGSAPGGARRRGPQARRLTCHGPPPGK